MESSNIDNTDPDNPKPMRVAAGETAPDSLRKAFEKAGIKLETVTPEVAETAAMVACANKQQLLPEFNGIYGRCVDCYIEIGWSHTAPTKPDKLCMKCAVIRTGLHKKELEKKQMVESLLNDIKHIDNIDPIGDTN